MVVEPSGGSRPEFRDLDSFCKTEIAPWLKAHEGRQRSARRLRWLIIGTGFAALAAGCYYLLRQPAGTHEVWFLGLLAGAVAVVKLGNLPHWRLRTDVRTFVMSKLAGFFDFTYQEHAAIDEIELFRDLKLLPPDTSVDFGGGLQGVIESIPFQMVEIHLTERHATGRSSDTMTVFRGLLLSMPCNAAGIITVRRRGDVAWSDGEEQGAAALGDAAFHENYVVHESEPGAAGHVLGAAARRLFTKLDSLDGVGNVRLGIRSGRLLLVIERSIASFEDGRLDSSLADPDRTQALVALFVIPFDAVDAFRWQPASAPAAS